MNLFISLRETNQSNTIIHTYQYMNTKNFGTSGNDISRSIAVDQNGNIFVTGYTNGNLNGIINNGSNDAFLVKLDSNGILLWTKLIGSSGYDVGEGVIVDQYGNIFVTGFTNGNLNGITNNGSNDAFLVKLDF